jgi:polyphenol oxidase
MNCDYTGTAVSTAKASTKKRTNAKQANRSGVTSKGGLSPGRGWVEHTSRGVIVVQVAAFNKLPWLVHGFSTRAGGASEIDGETVLNLGAVEWDTRDNVDENKRRFQSALGGSDLTLVSLHQIHSDVVRCFDSVPAKQSKGDALATSRRGLLLGVRTADCAPVLVVDPKKRVVAAIHAGWRGTLARIVEKGVGELRRHFGSDPADLVAAIGPGIHGCCYEVDENFRDKFRAQFPYADVLFQEVFSSDPVRRKYPLLFMNQRAPGHGEPHRTVHLDLVEANRRQLLDAGIRQQNIWISDLCTSCRTDLFFSHRKERGVTGRMMAAIAIKCES